MCWLGSNWKPKGQNWTPCIAHCIDLMLEDVGKIAWVTRTLERVIQMIGYIYNHGGCVEYDERLHKAKRPH